MNYAGDNRTYRCNSITKPGHHCSNNAISQDALERALLLFIDKKVLNFRDAKAAVHLIRKKISQGKPSLEPLEKRLKQIEKERQRLIDLFRSGLIENDEVERELASLNEQKKAVKETLDATKAEAGLVEISDADIKRIIENLSDEVQRA